jgi:hypothetical protein
MSIKKKIKEKAISSLQGALKSYQKSRMTEGQRRRAQVESVINPKNPALSRMNDDAKREFGRTILK